MVRSTVSEEKVITRDCLEAIHKTYPIEAMILEDMIKNGKAVVVE